MFYLVFPDVFPDVFPTFFGENGKTGLSAAPPSFRISTLELNKNKRQTDEREREIERERGRTALLTDECEGCTSDCEHILYMRLLFLFFRFRAR